MSKKISMTARPQLKPEADKWVDNRSVPKPQVPDVPMKRLTIDIPAELHTRLKVICASRGKRMADVLRKLIEQEVAKETGSHGL
jgi:6-phosphogluconolactonase/glucosamine-6-phosphate isomerase/deaminase